MTIIKTQKRQVPLKMVGSNVFGRYPKISSEETFNMLISDGWQVPYAGHKKIVEIATSGLARGLYNSVPLNKLVIVIDNDIYLFSESGAIELKASIETYTSDVFIAENDANQIAICDKKDIWILDYKNNTFAKAYTPGTSPQALNFVPNYIDFQNGYFISAEANRAAWRLSKINDGNEWPDDAEHVGGFQSKADIPLATVRMPGRSNQLFVMGSTVTESWVNVAGAALFPYQKTTAFDIDYGCINQSTIASGDNFIIWLGVNEKSGLAILYTEGGAVRQISNDGINFKLAELEKPEDCYAFLFKQDGHLLYQATWPTDNVTYIWDFNTQKFFTLTDDNWKHHIAKRVAFFDNKYYFISFKDANLYELNSIYTTYDGKMIPRRRRTPNFRLASSAAFLIDNVSFHVEQGKAKSEYTVDLGISRDGGQSYGNNGRTIMRTLGNRKNKFKRWNLGRANDLVFQFDFWSNDRVLFSDGLMNIHGRHVNESA